MANADGLKSRLLNVRERIENAAAKAGRQAGDVRLIAVTKNHPAEILQALIDLGMQDIGENRVQEICEKVPQLRGDFTMHLIGHLQTNKAQKVFPLAHFIHSVDSVKLIRRLESLWQSGLPKKKVLVEVNTSGEASKFGCGASECLQLCEEVSASGALELRGLMTIGPLDGDERAVRGAFAKLRELSQKCCGHIAAPELSMGMSGDFEWAIAEGATMVRIGTLLVGERDARPGSI